jgi:hypothetical protein
MQVEDRPVLVEPPETPGGPVVTLRWSNPLVRRVTWTAVGLLTVAAVALAVAGTWSRVPEFDWRLRPAWLAVAAVAFLGLHLTHAGLWRRVLHHLGHNVEARRSRAIWCTSGLARYTPGSVLMPMVRVAMTNPEGVPKRECLASVVYEMALMLTGSVLVGAYAVVQTPSFGGAARYTVLVIPLAAMICLHPRIFGPMANVALKRIGKQSLPRTLPVSAIGSMVVLYSASWILAGAGLYALIEGLHPIQPDDFFVVLAAPAVGYIAAALAFMLPGGIGAREGGLAAVLSVALPLGVGVAVAVGLRLLQLTVELGAAVATPLIARRTRPR